jgi:hypothetical protein
MIHYNYKPSLVVFKWLQYGFVNLIFQYVYNNWLNQVVTNEVVWLKDIFVFLSTCFKLIGLFQELVIGLLQ